MRDMIDHTAIKLGPHEEVILHRGIAVAVPTGQRLKRSRQYMDSDVPQSREESALPARYVEVPQPTSDTAIRKRPRTMPESVMASTELAIDDARRHHFSTPSSMSATPYSTRTEEHTASQVGPRPVQSKPTVNFVYRIILSRSPVYQSKNWRPDGKFQDKSLKQLLKELPLEKPKELIFTLEGPSVKVEEQIDCDDEMGFEAMKRHYNKVIKSSLTNHSSSEPLCLEIEIEPMYGNEPARGGEDEEEGDFDW